MIKFLKPIIEENKITYPVQFNNHISKKKYDIVTEYLSPTKVEINDSIEGIMGAYAPLAICNNFTMVSEVPVDKKFHDNLMEMVKIFQKFRHEDVLFSCKPGAKVTKSNTVSADQLSSNPTKLATVMRDVTKFGLKIDAKLIDKPPNKSERCASSISGGVDSIYTLIKNNNDITDLFYVIGYDIAVKETNKEWIDEVVEYNRKIAEKFNKNFVLCRSNLLKEVKSFSVHNIAGSEWSNYLVGGGIAFIIYPLGFKKLLISGDGLGVKKLDSKVNIFGKMFEDNFTSNMMHVEHFDGAPRWEKIHQIAKHDKSLLPALRFCVKYNADGGLNCGHCIKCIITYCMCYLLGLSQYMEIKRINDENYKVFINKFLKEITWSPYKPQLQLLLDKFDNTKKETTIQ